MFIFDCVSCTPHSPSPFFAFHYEGILQQYRDHANDSMLLKHVIDSFDGSYYAHAALGMCTLIKTAEPSCYSQTDLFASLGKQLAIFPPPEEQRMPLLNEV